jgi:hypothetical protein
MPLSQSFICLFAGILGIVLYLFVVKIPSALQHSKVANVNAGIADYFAHDYPSVIASLISVIIGVICADEFLRWQPAAQGYLKIIFAFYGFTGSSILIAIFGKFNKYINSIVDIKTDIADNKVPTVS